MADLSEDERQQKLKQLGERLTDEENRVLSEALTHSDPAIRAEALLAIIGEIELYKQMDQDVARAEEWFAEHGDGVEPPSFMSERLEALLEAGSGQDYSVRFRERLK